jgi:NADH dehydrogenase FAD-containing subunit
MRSSGAREARPRIVIIGAGYAGYHCARGLERRLPAVDIVIISPTDYMPYLSLLPEVGAGIVDPRHIAVSLSATLRHAWFPATRSARTLSTAPSPWPARTAGGGRSAGTGS